MTGKQHELDQFSCKGKQLGNELKNIPECESEMLKKDVETLVDQWLDVSHTTLYAIKRWMSSQVGMTTLLFIPRGLKHFANLESK